MKRPERIIDDIQHYLCGNTDCDRTGVWLPEAEFSALLYGGRKSECKRCAARRMREARKSGVKQKREMKRRHTCRDCGLPVTALRCNACRMARIHEFEGTRVPWWQSVARPVNHEFLARLERVGTESE